MLARADVADLGLVDDLFDWVRPDGPGCALGIYRDGAPLLRGFGLANIEHGVLITPDTVFHIASLSKQVTAFCVALLAERMAVDLDEPIGTFLPELRVGGDATLRQILHHSSGMRDQWGLLDLAGWRHQDLKTDADVWRLATRQRALNFAPGTRFQYINTGYTLLGMAIERITGKSLRDFADQAVFAALGMRRTFFHDDSHEVVPGRADAYACGEDGALRINVPAYATVGPTGLYTSVADFAAWERHLLAPEICSPALVAEMHRSGTLADGQPTGYGYGLAIGSYRGLDIAEHAGGDAAFRAHYLRFPDQRLAIAIFCNTDSMPPGRLARQIADRILEARFAEVATARVSAAQASRATGITLPSGDALLGFCGRFREAGGHDLVEVRYREGRLFLIPPCGPDYELAALDAETFAFVGMDATCRFTRAPDAPVQLRTFYGSTQTALLETVEHKAAAAPLVPEDYIGRYSSAELDTRYDVEAQGGALLLVRGKLGARSLTPLAHDSFACAGGLSIRFVRDAANVATAMMVSTERAWDVRFERESIHAGGQGSAIAGHPDPSISAPSR